MKTKENIEGKEIVIDWEWVEPVENLKSDWHEWLLSGIGSDGKEYSGACQADSGLNLRDDNVYHIEEV